MVELLRGNVFRAGAIEVFNQTPEGTPEVVWVQVYSIELEAASPKFVHVRTKQEMIIPLTHIVWVVDTYFVKVNRCESYRCHP